MNKILISLVSFLVTFTLTTFLPEDQEAEFLWNIGVSLFVAGVAFVVQYLFSVEQRLANLTEQSAEHQKLMLKQLTAGFFNVRTATELFAPGNTRLTPEEITRIGELVRSLEKITADAEPLVRQFAKAEVTRSIEYLKRISDGSALIYKGEDRDWLLGLTELATRTIHATSLSTVDASGHSSVDGGLWRRELGQRYLSCQRQAIRRGVRVRRLFIVDREGMTVHDLTDDLRLHLKIGVEVRVLDATAFPTVRGRLADFIVFDDVVSFRTTAAPLVGQFSPIVTETTLLTDRESVRRWVDEFAELWSLDGVREAVLVQGEVVFRAPGTATAD